MKRSDCRKPQPIAAGLQFEGVLAIEDAGHQQAAAPAEFLLGLGPENLRREGHGRFARRLDLHAQPRTRVRLALDRDDEGVPLGEAGKVGEHAPDAPRRGGNLDMGIDEAQGPSLQGRLPAVPQPVPIAAPDQWVERPAGRRSRHCAGGKRVLATRAFPGAVARGGFVLANLRESKSFPASHGDPNLSSRENEDRSHVASETTGVSGLAERYAAALFDLADERKALDEVAGDLRQLRAMLRDERRSPPADPQPGAVARRAGQGDRARSPSAPGCRRWRAIFSPSWRATGASSPCRR